MLIPGLLQTEGMPACNDGLPVTETYIILTAAIFIINNCYCGGRQIETKKTALDCSLKYCSCAPNIFPWNTQSNNSACPPPPRGNLSPEFTCRVDVAPFFGPFPLRLVLFRLQKFSGVNNPPNITPPFGRGLQAKKNI